MPKKYDKNKPRTDLINPKFILKLAESLAYGADKYDEVRGETPNYLKNGGFNYSQIYASLQRHLNQWYSGEDIDEESGLNHLQLAAANIHFLCTYVFTENGIDDRMVINGQLQELNETEKDASERSKVGRSPETKKKNKKARGRK